MTLTRPPVLTSDPTADPGLAWCCHPWGDCRCGRSRGRFDAPAVPVYVGVPVQGSPVWCDGFIGLMTNGERWGYVAV